MTEKMLIEMSEKELQQSLSSGDYLRVPMAADELLAKAKLQGYYTFEHQNPGPFGFCMIRNAEYSIHLVTRIEEGGHKSIWVPSDGLDQINGLFPSGGTQGAEMQ